MSKMNSIFGIWAGIMSEVQSDAMAKSIEEMQKPVEERIEKRKKDIEENKMLFENLDMFSKEEDKTIFDIKGIEEAIDDILDQPNFDNVSKPNTIDGKIELVKDRVQNIIKINELLLMMEEDELKSEQL